MATYKVEKRNGSICVIGLKDDAEPDTMLLYHYSAQEAETPDIDSPRNEKQMHGALYDLLQTNDALHDGDCFETPFGRFLCTGVHVIAAD
jgi:hypothetical protein